MKKILLFLFLVTSVKLQAQDIQPEYKKMLDSLHFDDIPQITVQELKTISSAYILDTREENEYQISHLKKARHAGYIWFDMRKVYDIPLNATIVVYCSSGARSNKIAAKLIQYGYQQVFSLYGGIFQWINEGNPVYRSNGVQTSEIHVFNADWSKWLTEGTKVY